MPTFKLTWTIDAEGTDALDAARRVATDYFQARIAQGHPDTACVFQLTDHEGQAVTIDLSAHRIHLECAHAAECERLRAMLTDWEADANLLEKERDEARAELSALKAHPEAYQFDGQVLRDEHGNYLAEFMAYEQSFIDRLLHPQPELKAQQVGQEPAGEVHLRTGGGISLLHVELAQPLPPGTKLYTAPQPAPAQDVAGLVEALKTIYDEDYQAPHDSTDGEIKESMKRCIFRIRRIVKDALAAHDKQNGEKKS